jgi:hypothetical protein
MPLFGEFGLQNQLSSSEYARPRKFREKLQRWLDLVRTLWPECPARIMMVLLLLWRRRRPCCLRRSPVLAFDPWQRTCSIPAIDSTYFVSTDRRLGSCASGTAFVATLNQLRCIGRSQCILRTRWPARVPLRSDVSTMGVTTQPSVMR